MALYHCRKVILRSDTHQMNKSFIKGISVIFFAVIAITVVIIGQHVNSRNQYQQRVEFAETSADLEREKLNNVEKMVNSLYADENQVFLTNETTTERVEELRSQLASVKITAADYAIREESLPDTIQGLAEQKIALQEKMIDIQDKSIIQDRTSQLFTEPISNWQEVESGQVIKTDLNQTAIGAIREELTLFPDTQWKVNLSEYLEEANEQVQQAEELQETLEHYLTEGVAVTYTDYLNALYAIEAVPNEELRARFNELIDQLASNMGLQ